MLRMADGDIKKLAMMIGIDWSEIRNRENNPILNTIQEEDIQKLEEFMMVCDGISPEDIKRIINSRVLEKLIKDKAKEVYNEEKKRKRRNNW